MKYVMLRTKVGTDTDRDVPIIFPEFLSHIDVANAVQAEVPELKDAPVVSAGDFDVVSGECSGNSITLQIAAREEEDTRIILTYDYLHGIIL